MDSLSLGIAIAGLIIGIFALAIGATSLIYVVGIKNSTHQITWKEVTPNTTPAQAESEVEEESFDPFNGLNPNKRQKPDEDFADLDDPTTQSNF